MLAIEVELLHGTIRAGSADDLAITGAGDRGEWPPSPARLFAALVAGDGTGPRMQVTTGVELVLLEQAAAPVIVCDPDDDVLRAPLVERFVVVDASKPSTVQDYPARTAEGVRMADRLSPRRPVVTYLWDLEPTDDELAGLKARAARVGYFGCADSPARVRVRAADALPADVDRTWRPDEAGDAFVATPSPGLLAAFDEQFTAFSEGTWVRRAWLPSDRTVYRRPGRARPVIHEAVGATVWFQLDRSISGRHVLRVTEALRRATMTLLQGVVGPDVALPTSITGHGASEGPWDQAVYLALPHAGAVHADGRIHGAAVALPRGSDRGLVEAVTEALSGLVELRLAGGEVRRLQPTAWGAGPVAANPRRWTRPTRVFASVFPIVHDRFSKRGPALGDVARWCAHAGLPEPVGFAVDRLPLLAGAVQLAPSEAYRPGRERRPYTHLRVTFAEAVRGPVVLGAARSFGLGLLAPVDRRASVGGDA